MKIDWTDEERHMHFLNYQSALCEVLESLVPQFVIVVVDSGGGGGGVENRTHQRR